MRSLSILATACLALAAAPALAQTPETEEEDDFVFDRACMDEYGRDLCDQGIWSGIVTRFGLEPAGRVQAAGLRGVRVFTVNGYSSDMPAITILTAGRKDAAELTVHWEKFGGAEKAHLARLERPASPDLWRLAIDLQALAAASPERQPEIPLKDGDRDVICLHPWVTVTESLTDSGVTRRIRNACDDDALFEASYDMSAEALHAFPDCGRLEPANYRNESTILRRCFTLDGEDKSAAAEVLNIFDSEIDIPSDLATRFVPDIRLTLPGRPAISGAAAVTRALADPELSDVSLYANHVAGEAGRVTANGSVETELDVDDRYKAASIQLIWSRNGNDWRIASIAIGAFKTIDN